MAELLIAMLEIIGTVSFSISGAMSAIQKELDLLGVVIVGSLTAIGGGILRDIILGNIPPRSFLHYGYPLLALATALCVFLIACLLRERYSKNQEKISAVNNIFDAIGLGIFTIAGINEGLASPYANNLFLLLFLGVLTGVGGGVMRDMMLQVVPVILRKRVYALASLCGGFVYAILMMQGILQPLAILLSFTATFSIRMCATYFKWNLPRVRLEQKEKQ